MLPLCLGKRLLMMFVNDGCLNVFNDGNDKTHVFALPFTDERSITAFPYNSNLL